MQELIRLFESWGLDQKDAEVFFMCWKLGITPASTIAAQLDMLRTTTYTILLQLVDLGLVQMTIKKGVRYFFVHDMSILDDFHAQKQQSLRRAEADLEQSKLLMQQEASLRYPALPKMQFFEGASSIKQMYEDMLHVIDMYKYLVIKFVASNTFDLQVNVQETLQTYAQTFFQRLQENNIGVVTYLAQGDMIMESIQKLTQHTSLIDIPAGQSAVNLFVVGKAFYIMIFKQVPIGIKIESEELSAMMHFLLNNLKVT